MKILGILSMLLISFQAIGQYDHQEVFKGMEGEQLFEALKDNYKPDFVLDFGSARDTLFAVVYAEDNILTCVYTGHSLEMDPNEDPTTNVYMNGDPNGINTEHTWPRSKGADVGNAKSDMHHLYPTRSIVNSARGNDPFAEIPDGETDKWYVLDETSTTIPTSNISDYSEDKHLCFEPREDHKGNVARAMFYFYTMYRNEALASGPDFFDIQRETLCDWHWQDPVDEKEWIRNQKIAEYQDDKLNPFILDCSLAARLYCPEIDNACAILDNENIKKSSPKIFPNPSNGRCTVDWQGEHYNILIADAQGRVLQLSQGQDKTELNMPQSKGIYFLSIATDENNRFTIKLVNE